MADFRQLVYFRLFSASKFVPIFQEQLTCLILSPIFPFPFAHPFPVPFLMFLGGLTLALACFFVSSSYYGVVSMLSKSWTREKVRKSSHWKGCINCTSPNLSYYIRRGQVHRINSTKIISRVDKCKLAVVRDL